MSDFYQVLGIARTASADDIKKAYRDKAKEFHPDRNKAPEAEAMFKAVSEAYQVLSDPDKRAHYDRFGQAPGGASGGYGGGYQHIDLNEALSMFMRDFGGMGGFESIFGGGGGRGDRTRGQDVRITAKLSLREVATGVKRVLRIRTLIACQTCTGTGAARGTKPVSCSTCQGTGEVRRAARSMFGQFVQVGPCPACHGEGAVIRTPCEVCRGEGRLKGERTVNIEIPPGVTSQNYITSRGDGSAGLRGGPGGDLQVILEVEDDLRWQREGDDLVHELPVSFSQAALGMQATVPTPTGEERVVVPEGTQSGTVLKVKGKGLPRLNSSHVGDLHVRIHVWTPDDLNDEQRQLLTELAKHEGDGPSKRSSFWGRLKEVLGA